jgi:hypothetical protein
VFSSTGVSHPLRQLHGSKENQLAFAAAAVAGALDFKSKLYE